ncbi:MAG: crotonase/enoyl-CoA hydratase family protein [Myxococcales bacterium]|nr:crotonase/enoyl-CoA hydratase family protein [Myxococcales bacterium]MCB9731160.1 crotonase/enoyl-CoA hydratase family protein [Deltaproteobacteria bacterium]
MSEERVLVERDGAVLRVTMNRPDKRNGLDRGLIEGLVAAGEAAIADKGARCVVLAGSGPAFCAGLDFQSFMASGPAAREALLRRDGEANVAQRCAWIWQEVPVPVIAALQGAVFGGGLQIALGADLRYAGPDAELSVMEMRWGLVPDMAITQTARGLLPIDVLKELTFTGRRVGADEAKALGLVTRVCQDPLAEALATARHIAAQSPDAVRRAKRLLNEAPGLTRAAAFALETELQLELLGSKNQLEAVRANFTKSAPRFTDPE